MKTFTGTPPCGLKYHTMKPPVGYVLVQLRGFLLHPIRVRHWGKSTNGREGSRYGDYDAASGTIFRTSTKCSKRNDRNLVLTYYYLEKGGLQIQKPFARVKKVLI
jgi:hypothetical protein